MTMTAQDVFTDGLRNAHAMEKQALTIMEAQLNRLEHYPEVSMLLRRHIEETEGQVERLKRILEGMDESSSGFKDAAMSFTGAMSAAGHSFADDEILKNSFANYAFENFEIAAYTSLITVARMCGASSAIPLLEQSLAEERQMAAALSDGLETVTQRYISRGASGERADI
ncbi:MAG: ferritin-like domain-containing protein [Gemmobacter sp.]|jgi:ferritin-like metal-binding protein YciE|nr:ferritin-like domain-containing protein [Gemmobacter sp.]